MSDVESSSSGPDFVQSLERGLAVIKAFDQDNSRLTLSDVARRVGVTRATARRFLLTLSTLGYVRSDGRTFYLTPRVLDLGYAYLASQDIAQVAEPHMEALVAKVHESSSLSLLDGQDIVYVLRVPTRSIMTLAITVGTRFPAHATSMGRVLLAGLQEDLLREYMRKADYRPITENTITTPLQLRRILRDVNRQGYALVDQELELGLRALAVPVRSGGKVIAAINLSLPARQRSLESIRGEMLPPLRVAADEIEADLRSKR